MRGEELGESVVATRSNHGPEALTTTRARRCTGPAVGVGRSSFTVNSEVTVQGGRSAPAFTIRWCVAAQLLWQSSSVPTMPPESTPGKASW